MDRVIDLRNTVPLCRVAVLGDAGSTRDIQQSLNPHGIAFITPVKDEAQYRICLQYLDALQIPPGYSVERIAVFGGGSMAEVYQKAMEASTARCKIYLHVDTYLVHRGLLPELLNLFRTYPRLGIVGVSGATRLPASVLLSVNNPFHCYGRHWDYRRPGGPSSLLGPANRRRLHFSRFRSFVGDYLPAVAVDGFFMATQYDVPWTNPEFGFDLYDQVQALEFIKRGLEVGIARQEAIWCVHWGPLQEVSREQHNRRWNALLHHKAPVFRQLYPGFVGVPAQRLYEQHRGAGNFKSPSPTRERLGVVIVTVNEPEGLLRALRALLPQCEALRGTHCQVVVVDRGSTDGSIGTVRREFPQVIVENDASNDELARGFNLGLRQLSASDYILVMHNDVEFAAETLDRMLSFLRENPSTAGVVASLINPDKSVQSQRTAIVELIRRRPRRPRLVSFVGTTCALVRGEVFFDVGLYDERFHSHNEELDWSLRARRKGYRFALVPEARVIRHRSLGSWQNRSAFFAVRFAANLWFVYKHAGRRWAGAFYWAQRKRARWLAFRCRHDSEGLRQISAAMAQVKGLYSRFREENRRPQLL